MRAHTEVDDTVWSFVKVLLQFLVQNNYSQHFVFELLGKYVLHCTSNLFCVIFLCSYFQAAFKQTFLLNFK